MTVKCESGHKLRADSGGQTRVRNHRAQRVEASHYEPCCETSHVLGSIMPLYLGGLSLSQRKHLTTPVSAYSRGKQWTCRFVLDKRHVRHVQLRMNKTWNGHHNIFLAGHIRFELLR
ncbi:hypothetical protein KC358_g84 [Hortaea werneckii]|nr:hypothetical protein KC358_g84 [Hortaea werneckii]